MSIQHITTLLQFCLKNTYFLLQGKYYEQVHGTTMGSPQVQLWLSYSWKSLNPRPSALPPHPPRLWLGYDDGTFIIQKAEHSQPFLHHINSIKTHIQFHTEVPNSNGSIHIFDTLLSPGPDRTLLASLYQKPTHSGWYLHKNNRHSLSAKYGVFNTLT